MSLHLHLSSQDGQEDLRRGWIDNLGSSCPNHARDGRGRGWEWGMGTGTENTHNSASRCCRLRADKLLILAAAIGEAML